MPFRSLAGLRREPLPRRAARLLGCAALLMLMGSGVRAAPLDLSTLQVFASDSIRAERSDYQGPAAAGGAIDLTDFAVEGDLTAGAAVRFARGQIRGVIRSPVAKLDRVFGGRARALDGGEIARVSDQVDDLGRRLSWAPATTQPVVTRGELFGKPVKVIRIAATRDIDIVDLCSEDLASSGPNRLRLILEGSEASRLIVRVHGTNPSLRDVGFSTQGGLTPGQIVFAFPEATRLVIASSGGASGPDGTAWGIPGSVVAPRADLAFAAATITGQVFVRSIGPIDGLPSGQVNRLGRTEAEGRFTPSSAIETIRSAPASPCALPQAVD